MQSVRQLRGSKLGDCDVRERFKEGGGYGVKYWTENASCGGMRRRGSTSH